MNSPLEILATPLDDPSYCRFTLAIDSMTTKEVTFREIPMEDFFIKDLFETNEILEIIVDKNYLICKKKSSSPWQTLGKTIGNILRINHKKNGLSIPSQYFTSGESLPEAKFFREANQTFLESKVGKKIQELVELQIQPSLGAHGGSVRLLDLKDGQLFVVFSGGCQGCSQASVTVKDGIEKIITAKFPEVKTIVDVTNHSSGENPYFK